MRHATVCILRAPALMSLLVQEFFEDLSEEEEEGEWDDDEDMAIVTLLDMESADSGCHLVEELWKFYGQRRRA
ncbi:hypothetical protein EJB05_44452, partial [Eragrostis curvula]